MIESVEGIIEKHLADNWVMTPIAYDNVQFNEQRGIPFIRMSIEWVDSYPAGVKRERMEGYVAFSIFVIARNGIVESATIADELVSVFRSLVMPHLIFRTARVVRVGLTKEWYQRNLALPFTIDNCI